MDTKIMIAIDLAKDAHGDITTYLNGEGGEERLHSALTLISKIVITLNELED